MTSAGTLVLGAVAILFVIAWFVFGVVDGTRPERARHNGNTHDTEPSEQADAARHVDSHHLTTRT
ncbi:hypothetical protein [Terrabacter sp. 2RAF25]|uniref:hypothetical protein n=1 Tax=Terrabacter sp. 2RAF25 TaxID=3232998 RepID=UPI003F9A98BC